MRHMCHAHALVRVVILFNMRITLFLLKPTCWINIVVSLEGVLVDSQLKFHYHAAQHAAKLNMEPSLLYTVYPRIKVAYK